MIRTIFLTILGAITAGGVTALLLQNDSDPGPAFRTDEAAAPRVPIQAPDSFESSLAVQQSLAGLGTVADLESRINQARAGSAELEALLLKLAELDPVRAVRLARSLALDDGMLAQLFRVWASVDPDAALAEVGGMPASMKRRTVALDLLEVFGVDGAGIERVAAVFPRDEANNFRVDAFARLAERDVVAALAAADAEHIPAAVQTIAQQRIAQVMARIDPLAAFDQARSISPTFFRRRYVNTLIDTWAKIDPGATLDFLETAELPELELGPLSFRALAASSPERLLAVAENLSPATRTYAQQAVVAALTALDPVAAYQRVSTLPPSGDINQLITIIANRYTRQNPEAALVWAKSLEPRSALVLDRVIATIAETDPVRAANEMVSQIVDPVAATTAAMPSIVSMLSGPLSAADPNIALVADTLAANSDPRVRMQLDQLMRVWPQADPEGALDWTLRHTSALTRNMVSSVAQQLGSQNPTLAQQSLQRLPANQRGAWLVGAASGMARSDFEGTVSWVQRFRDDPSYTEALQAAAFGGVSEHPATVARLVDQNPDIGAQVAPLVASSWGASDPAAAEQWVLGRAQGAEQDQMIMALLQGTASAGQFNAGLLQRMSSSESREQAVMLSVTRLARTNPSLGRELVEEHISDPGLRASALAQLEGGGTTNQMPMPIFLRP